MFCSNCGAKVSENANFCNSCGERPKQPQTAFAGNFIRIGFSSKINDPAFARYIKSTNRWSAIFSAILAVAAVAGFYIAGEAGAEGMENPQALFIGLGVGGMFLLIALLTIIRQKRTRTWDGVVADKTIRQKQRTQNAGNDDDYIQYYTEYAVIVRDERGKTHRITAEDDDTQYNYYQIGDRVRHHAGLNSYEKYDKSRDSIIFCSACATLCDINDDICFRCKCPLLK